MKLSGITRRITNPNEVWVHVNRKDKRDWAVQYFYRGRPCYAVVKQVGYDAPGITRSFKQGQPWAVMVFTQAAVTIARGQWASIRRRDR
jgi:hypothetical protein